MGCNTPMIGCNKKKRRATLKKHLLARSIDQARHASPRSDLLNVRNRLVGIRHSLCPGHDQIRSKPSLNQSCEHRIAETCQSKQCEVQSPIGHVARSI